MSGRARTRRALVSGWLAVGLGGAVLPQRSEAAPPGPNDPLRFLGVTKWYGRYTYRVRTSHGTMAEHTEPADHGPARHERFKASGEILYNSTINIWFDEKNVTEDDPAASAADWQGPTSGQTRYSAQSEREFWADQGEYHEYSDNIQESHGIQSFARPRPKTPNYDPDDDPQATHGKGTLRIDFRRGTYDFTLGPPRNLLEFQGSGRTLSVVNGKQKVSEQPPGGKGMLPYGWGVDLRQYHFPMVPGIVPKAPPPDPATMLATMQQDRYKLPTSGLVLSQREIVPCVTTLPHPPWVQGADPKFDCDLEIEWSFTPYRLKLDLEPVDEGKYRQWLPLPMDKGALYPGAERLQFRAKVSPVDGQPQKGVIKFKLDEVSSQRGTCQNDPPYQHPLTPEPTDMKFADPQPQGIRRISDTECETTAETDSATVTVEATDTAASSKLIAECLGVRGQYKDHEDVTVPLDDDHNGIADEWEKDAPDHGRSSDKEPKNNQAHEGDGLTLLEEYRGFIVVKTPGGQPEHLRTSPKEKDVFFISQNVDVGAHRDLDPDLFYKFTKLRPHQVVKPYVDTNPDGTPRDREDLVAARAVDFWSPGGLHTYALRVERIDGHADPNHARLDAAQLAQCKDVRGTTSHVDGTGPRTADYCFYWPDRMKAATEYFFGLLRQALDAPATPFPAPNGRALGDRLPELSAWARDHAREAVNRYYGGQQAVVQERLARDMSRLTVVHEMAHGCDAPHHEPVFVDPKGCLMRYFTVAEEWECLIRGTCEPAWSMVGYFFLGVCRGSDSQCTEKLRTK